jgi:Protein of unknown function (DUF3040)
MASRTAPWEVDVPLSDNEQRLLEQMERALYAEDPKFASTMRGANRRVGAGRKILIGGGAVVLGLVGLVAGVARGQYILAILGFVLMLAGTAYALSSQRRGGGGAGPTGVVGPGGSVKSRPAQRRRGGTFMQRLEQRWDRRRDQG